MCTCISRDIHGVQLVHKYTSFSTSASDYILMYMSWWTLFYLFFPRAQEEGQADPKYGSVSPAAGVGQSPDEKPDPEEVISWNEFAQNTTFHGIKYIFDKKPIGIRR